jgi:hypothetical protein
VVSVAQLIHEPSTRGGVHQNTTHGPQVLRACTYNTRTNSSGAPCTVCLCVSVCLCMSVCLCVYLSLRVYLSVRPQSPTAHQPCPNQVSMSLKLPSLPPCFPPPCHSATLPPCHPPSLPPSLPVVSYIGSTPPYASKLCRGRKESWGLLRSSHLGTGARLWGVQGPQIR